MTKNTANQTEYLPFTTVSILYYSRNQENVLEFLLIKAEGEDQLSQEIREDILESDVTGIIAAARIMVQKFRGCFSKKNLAKIVNGEQLAEDDLVPASLNRYEMWNHPLFFESIRMFLQTDHTIELENGTHVLFVELPNFDLKILNQLIKGVTFEWRSNESLKDKKQTDLELSQIASEFDFSAYIGADQATGSDDDTKRNTFIILSCKPIDLATAVDPMYLHFPALFQGLFRRAGENWIHYNAAADEFPTEELMKSVKAIIIPGSSASIYDRHEGIDKLKEWVKAFDVKYPKVKMLGICFGAQTICESLGGKVDKMEPRKQDPEYYLVASQLLEPSADFYKLPFVNKNVSDDSKRLCIVEAHGDEIKKLPRGFRNLVSSTTCKNEFIVSENGRYLGLQGHPEYSADFIASKVAMMSDEIPPKGKSLEQIETDKTEILTTDFKDSVTSDSLRAICYSFLKQ